MSTRDHGVTRLCLPIKSRRVAHVISFPELDCHDLVKVDLPQNREATLQTVILVISMESLEPSAKPTSVVHILVLIVENSQRA